MAEWGVAITREGCNRWVGVAMGLILDEVAREFGVRIDPAEFVERRDAAYTARCLAHGEPRPRRGVLELLNWLDETGRQKAIGSNANRAKLDFNLRQSGLADAFTVHLSVDDVTCGKPHPEMFLRAAELLGVEPSRCLVLEDSVSGLRAARAAGMMAVAVEGSLPVEVLRGSADLIFPDPLGLHLELQRLTGNP
jgi:HAD superfamily hydrolase (TIGR01509 family)